MISQDVVRHYKRDDLDRLVEIYHAVETAIGAEHWLTADMLQNFLDSPGLDVEKDTFIVERHGRVIAYGDFEFSDETGRSWAEGAVDPAHWGEGIGSELIRLTEARALERGAGLPPEKPLTIMRHTNSKDARAIRMFEQAGYDHIRTFYRMRIDFDQPIEAPPLPAGLTLRPFDRERDARAVYEAHEEAFEDHWGFERDSFEEWTHYMLDYAGQDFSMWLIAYDGDEIAGLCLNRPNEHDPQLGWVGTLGVRRNWRKRGLGSALLRQSFALFQQRGFTRAGLGVDASSLTNAVALYEGAGMHVHSRTFNYRKVLRGTVED